MTTWDDLVSVALVGTERRPMPAPLTAGVSTVLGVDLPGGPPELGVLTAAGVLATYRRTGWTPPHTDEPPPEPAPADDRRLPSAPATQLLELLLSGQVSVYGGAGFLVAEWLERCAATGYRLPDRLLPGVLAAATGDRSLRAAAAGAGGHRLGWLAGRNPDWAWAVARVNAAATTHKDPASVWSTGSTEARLTLFRELRATRPDEARRLAEESWAGENAKDRTAIVAAMVTGLGPGDEPFLEGALDDRSKGVRQEAAALLATLPTSRLAARMAERLRPLVSAGGRFRKKLEIQTPEELDAAARRDGIVDDLRPSDHGLRGWWLVQLIGATPLTFWTDHTGFDPVTIVGLAESRARRALVLAVSRQRDAQWASALVPHRLDAGLVAVLSPADADAALAHRIKSAPDGKLFGLCQAASPPWTARTSQAVIARFQRATTSGPLMNALPVLAKGLHPSAARDVERWVEGLREDDYARRIVRGLAHALSIRQSIVEEFT